MDNLRFRPRLCVQRQFCYCLRPASHNRHDLTKRHDGYSVYYRNTVVSRGIRVIRGRPSREYSVDRMNRGTLRTAKLYNNQFFDFFPVLILSHLVVVTTILPYAFFFSYSPVDVTQPRSSSSSCDARSCKILRVTRMTYTHTVLGRSIAMCVRDLSWSPVSVDRAYVLFPLRGLEDSSVRKNYVIK